MNLKFRPAQEESIKERWQLAWSNASFRKQLISGSLILTVILISFPFFFQFIEGRSGPQLNDWLLAQIPPHDLSAAIFIIIWSISLLGIVRAIQVPEILTHFIWSYILLTLVRTGTIYFIPLDPPANLIPLADPISNAFYGKHFITKDLFFSGHTATIFLVYLCLRKRGDRIIALISSIVLGILLLVQHVHYTIDVLTAPIFTYALDYLAKRLILR
ncbi:MAG: hypothetical protein C5B59_01365 [Bacteroidetes bacterium]|nr:MAG: hypothetical protein C5B59_01365 [Bacteroidota bacterium]